jgi:hypothetical protein
VVVTVTVTGAAGGSDADGAGGATDAEGVVAVTVTVDGAAGVVGSVEQPTSRATATDGSAISFMSNSYTHRRTSAQAGPRTKRLRQTAWRFLGTGGLTPERTSGSDIREVVCRAVLAGDGGSVSTATLLTEVGSGWYRAEVPGGMYL